VPSLDEDGQPLTGWYGLTLQLDPELFVKIPGVTSVIFGGGTPATLPPTDFPGIIAKLRADALTKSPNGERPEPP
jgi:hypothetical protein